MRKIVMIAILVVSMVQGVFAQQIIIKGTVKDATSKKAAEYVNVVLQTADSVFVGGTTTNGKVRGEKRSVSICGQPEKA